MHDVTEQFDDLVSIRGTLRLLPSIASPTTKRDLEALIRQTERNLTKALRGLSEEELERVFATLDERYNNVAQAELMTLIP